MEAATKPGRISNSEPAVPSSSPSSATLATEFKRFSKLPLELRSKIWKFASGSEQPNLVTFKRKNMPAVVHTCQEARRESGYLFHETSHGYSICINPKLDFLFLSPHSFPETIAVSRWSSPFSIAGSHYLSFLVPAKNLVLMLHEVVLITRSWGATAWVTFRDCFPDLEVLYLQLRPGPAGVNFEDMYFAEDDIPVNLADEVALALSSLEALEDIIRGLEIRLIRTERWIS